MIYEFDTCVLDTATQQLSCDGEVVHTEPQVLAVLEYLLANHDRVVTKIELLDEVWGDRFVSESALTSRIKLARKACGDSGREQRIVKTVHGRGYRLVAGVVERRPDSPAPRRSPGTTPTGTALVGRDAELAILDETLAATAAGERRVAFITGVTGVGKSALLSEVLERIDDPGAWNIVRGDCLHTRAGAEPYFALMEALGDLARQAPDTAVEILDRVAPSWMAQFPALLDDERADRLERRLLGSAPGRMLREGAEVFHELATLRPTVLVLEDLQWADEHTLDVVDLLATRATPCPLLVLGTARDDPSPAGDLIAETAAARRASDLHLTGLDVDAVGALVRSTFDGTDIDQRLVEVVANRSGGIPLFANEILAVWARRRMVTQHEEGVAIHAEIEELASAVPETLVPLLRHEMAGLDEEVRATLECAAVAGAEFDSAAVAAGLHRPLEDVEEVLDRAATATNYIEAQRGNAWPDGTRSTTFEFSNQLHRDVLYDSMAPAQRTRTHHAIGLALEAGFPEPGDLSIELANHFVQAGDASRAAGYLVTAGERAAARDAHGDALNLMDRALTECDRLPDGDDRNSIELRIRTGLGPALVASTGWLDDRVAHNYRRAVELCRDRPPCPEWAAARYGMATVTELHGEFGTTEELLGPLLDVDSSGDLAVAAHELTACSLFHQGAFDRSLANSDAVLAGWDEEAYSVAMARIAEHPASSCNGWASLASWALGRSDESLRQAEASVRLGEENRYALSTAAQQRALFHQLRNETDDTEYWAQRTREIGREQDFPMRIVQADIYRGWAIGVTRSPEEGMALIEEGLRQFRAAEARLNEAYYLGLHADTMIHAGQPDDALDALNAAFDRMATTTRSYFFESELHRLCARALRAQGDLDGARGDLQTSLEIARGQGATAFALRTAVDLLELELAEGDPDPVLATVTALMKVFDGQSPTPDVVRARQLLKL